MVPPEPPLRNEIGKDASSATGGRLARIALAVLVLGTTLSLFRFVHPFYDPYPDASIYIATARSLLEGSGYSYLGDPFIVRPPGFSILIAPILALFGTNFLVLNTFISLFGIACVALLFVYMRPRLGVTVTLAVCVAIWLHPLFLRLCNQTLSEVPGAALMLACLCVDRWARRNPGRFRDGLLGILIGASAYVRSMNVFLAPAIVLARAAEARGRGTLRNGRWRALAIESVVLLGVPFLLLAPWNARNARVEPQAPAEQVRNYSYSVFVFHEDRADPASPRLPIGEVLGRIPGNLVQVTSGLGGLLLGQSTGGLLPRGTASPARLIAGSLAMLCVLIALARRRDTAEMYFLMMLVPLSISYDIDERHLLPFLILALPAVADAALAVTNSLTRPPLSRSIAAAAIMVVAFGFIDPGAHLRDAAAPHEQRAAVTDYVAERFGPEVPLAGYTGFHYAVYLDRPVYSLRFAMNRDGLPGALRIMDEQGVGGVIIDTSVTGSGELVSYLGVRHGIETTIGTHAVIRISEPAPD